MLTNKQRTALRSMANGMETIFSVGKNGVTPDVTAAVADALAAREMVKISVLNNCETEPREIAETLAGRTRSDVVQVIGKRIVLFKKNPKREGIAI